MIAAYSTLGRINDSMSFFIIISSLWWKATFMFVNNLMSPTLRVFTQNLPRLVVLTALRTSVLVSGQSCSGTETFEKISHAELKDSTSSLLISSPGNNITAECLERCLELASCKSLVLHYGQKACTKLSKDSSTEGASLRLAVEPKNYFEKVCLSVPTCSKMWMFERVVGYVVEGFDDVVVNEVPSRIKCAELCLSERGMNCRSAEYHEKDRVCHLSRQDRRTQPLSFRPSSRHVHYLENQCADVPSDSQCDYEAMTDQDIGHGDVQIMVRSQDECQKACDREQSFHCRSFSWNSLASICILSGDDIMSAGSSSMKELKGVTYYQRAPCLNLDLECSVDAMVVQLKTKQPFQGRIFAQNFPLKCETKGKNHTDTQLTIKYSDPNCGMVDEGNGVYSNIVVVQHHPVIQRRGDKAIKLLCLFQTSNKTITDSFDLDIDNSVSGAVATAIVNATAPSPRLRLRIVDRLGRDVRGARLGEELFLRLEIDENSIYGILARNLVAKSGDNKDSIVLLDDRGCPTDPLVFPSLNAVPNSKSLQGKFEAFKFSEDTVVRFQVNVQFCFEKCEPVQCGLIESYGKKRKRRALTADVVSDIKITSGTIPLDQDTTESDNRDEHNTIDYDTIYHDIPLQKEIIVDNSHVKQLRNGLLLEESDTLRLAQLVCTSREVMIAIVVSAVILQICIILIAIMCIYARRRKRMERDSSYIPAITLTRGARSPFTVSEDSLSTLKTLRTSLRD